ncbi:MAG: hypothetical protein ACOX6U_04555 [Oscillospiraceae bacterium]|jgi:hypothetical protein
MDDLMAKLQDVLSSSEGQDNLKNLAGMLGGQDQKLDLGAIGSLLGQSASPPPKEEPKPAGLDLSGLNLGALSALLGQSTQNQPKQEEPQSGGFDLGGLDIGALMKMGQVMQSMKKDDKNTALVRAIKPHLKPERQHRADEALRLMQLVSMLPALKESGILGNLFGGD